MAHEQCRVTPGISCAALSVATNASTPRFSSVAPEQNPENKLREYSKDKKYNEGDLASRNRYGDYVTQSCEHKKKENMLENSHHFATPLSNGT
jgi:hypothetical protein